MHDVVVKKSSRSVSRLLMSFLFICQEASLIF